MEFFLDEKKISGFNESTFIKNCASDTLIMDLSENMIVDSIFLCNEKTEFLFKKNKLFIPIHHFTNNYFNVKIFYSGSPKIAKNPPWKGGFVYERDNSNMHWVGVACQNDGASLWWPTIDDVSDEPDSLSVEMVVIEPYFLVSNGRLDSIVQLNNSRRKFCWSVSNPINNYNVTFNIANYVHFSDSLKTTYGKLDLDYYVLPSNLNKAKNHFSQVKPMLSFFETKFGPFPFYEDGYKLVETSYLGMEHQSCISYGNQYKNGYLGLHPENIDFDFIIIHETAHEWWGNSLSMINHKDMWIHESFATYAEALYVEEFYGYQEMLNYLNYQKVKIKNKQPIISSNHKTTDIYYKGTWVLHTLRSVLNNDRTWFSILLNLQLEFKHKIVTTNDITKCIENLSGLNLESFFFQYLFNSDLPVFDYFFDENEDGMQLHYRWTSSDDDFSMPILVTVYESNFNWIYPTKDWKSTPIYIKPYKFKVAENLFLLETNLIK